MALACLTHLTLRSRYFQKYLTTQADLNETSLEQSMIDIAAMTDERGLRVAARG